MAAPTIAVTGFVVGPEYIRLPQAGKHDPLFGLTRSYLNLLILPLKENDFQPSVRSSVLRQGGAKTGVRLINVASLRAYLKKQMRTAHEESTSAPVDLVASSPAPVSGAEFLRLPREKERDPLFGTFTFIPEPAGLGPRRQWISPAGVEPCVSTQRISHWNPADQRGQPERLYQAERRTWPAALCFPGDRF